MADELEIGPMSVDELDTVLSWAADEGWNPGLADAAAFHAVDPEGFFKATVKDEPVAAISVVNHDSENSFLGLYLCRPEWRGRGIGFKTWRHGLEHAETRSVGLDGVPDQQENYRVSGFVRAGQSMRYVGRWPAQKAAAARPAVAEDLSKLIELDARANGFARPRFLSAWVNANSSHRATRVIMSEGAIGGFATWRACVEGTKIGPLVAPDTKTAIALISDIAALRPDGPLIIDVPEANRSLRSELQGAGFEVPFVTARMYRGQAPIQGRSLQAIATMELG